MKSSYVIMILFITCLRLEAYNPRWYNPNIVSLPTASSDRLLHTSHKHRDDELSLLLEKQTKIDIQVRDIKNQIAASQALVNLRELRQEADNIRKDHQDSAEVQSITKSVIDHANSLLATLYRNFNIPAFK